MNYILFHFDKRVFFIILCLFSVLFTYIMEEIFFTNQFYFDAYAGQMSFGEINRIIAFKEDWYWVGYITLPLLYFFKFSVVATTLFVGVFFLDLKYSFKKQFQIAMIAEVVFLVPVVLKIIWFAFIQTDFTLEEFTSFYPLSLQNTFLDVQVEPWFLYPLQVVNVFEVGYWFVLAAGISMAFKEDFNKSLSLVIKSYGLGLLLWITLIVFLTLNFS